MATGGTGGSRRDGHCPGRPRGKYGGRERSHGLDFVNVIDGIVAVRMARPLFVGGAVLVNMPRSRILGAEFRMPLGLRGDQGVRVMRR